MAQGASLVRLRRQGGRIIQDCDIYIGRAVNRGGWELKSSKWHNPYVVIGTKPCTSEFHVKTSEEAVQKYLYYILEQPELIAALPELKGKRLGCWCKNSNAPNDQSLLCHGDVLLQLLDFYYGEQ